MIVDKSWWQKLSNFTQEKRIIVVSAMIALSQGLNSLTDLPFNYLYKDEYHMTPAQVSAIASLVSLPWIIKPCWGLISDNYPFFGYKRKTYIIFFGLLGFASYIGLSFWSSALAAGLFLIFFISFIFAFNNVIGEALLVEAAQKFGSLPGKTEADKQNQASQNVSVFFGVKHFGMIISSYSGGLLLEYISKGEIFKIASLAPLSVALIAFTLPETKYNSPRTPELPTQPSSEEDEAARLINGNQAETEERPNIKDSFRKVWHFLRQPEIYKPLIFLFLFTITPSTGSAMFFFYTNELHFPPEFMGKLKLVASCAIVFGIIIYNRFLRDIPFKKILLWSSVICFFLSLSQILLITRMNLNMGIPDKLFCIGDSIVIQVFGELNFLPMLILACRLCPKNVEGTMYALFLSVFNCGGMVSTQLGAFFTWVLGITESDFSNLWLLVFISSTFITLPLPWLSKVSFDAAVKKTEEGEICSERPSAREVLEVDDFKESSIKNA